MARPWTNCVEVKEDASEDNDNAMVKWIISEDKGADAAELKENKATGACPTFKSHSVGNDVIVLEDDVTELENGAEHMDVPLTILSLPVLGELDLEVTEYLMMYEKQYLDEMITKFYLE